MAFARFTGLALLGSLLIVTAGCNGSDDLTSAHADAEGEAGEADSSVDTRPDVVGPDAGPDAADSRADSADATVDSGREAGSDTGVDSTVDSRADTVAEAAPDTADSLVDTFDAADTGPLDTGPLDTGAPDTGPPDTGPPDTGALDTADACVTNVCGTCTTIVGAIGDACGTCGALACSADGSSLVCNDPGLNACGSCAVLVGAVGGACGTCGTLACAVGGASLVCNDPGANACGACAPEPAVAPSTVCGACNKGTYGCDPGGKTTSCAGDPGFTSGVDFSFDATVSFRSLLRPNAYAMAFSTAHKGQVTSIAVRISRSQTADLIAPSVLAIKVFKGTPTSPVTATLIGSTSVDTTVVPLDGTGAAAFMTFTLAAPTPTLDVGTPIYAEFTISGSNSWGMNFYDDVTGAPAGYTAWFDPGTGYPATSDGTFPAIVESMSGCF